MDAVEPHRLTTSAGAVRAEVIVVATEAYTPDFAGRHRDLVPLYSLMVGTEPRPLGVPRDWRCSVRFDRSSGIAVAGGYVGGGVATTNLAGRTLADLITGRDTDLTAWPWVGHHSRRWEAEPLRWVGINAGRRAAGAADAAEGTSSRTARWRPPAGP